jgi:hypothetical protein
LFFGFKTLKTLILLILFIPVNFGFTIFSVSSVPR